MAIITMNEFETEKVNALPNSIYNRITREIARRYGWNLAEKLLEKFGGMTVKELSCNSMFDIMSCFSVI